MSSNFENIDYEKGDSNKDQIKDQKELKQLKKEISSKFSEIKLSENQSDNIIAAFLASSGINYGKGLHNLRLDQMEVFENGISEKDINAAILLTNILIKKGLPPEGAGILASSFRLDWTQKEDNGSEIDKTELNFDVSNKDIEAAKLLYNRLVKNGFDEISAGALVSTFRLDRMQNEKWGKEKNETELGFDVSDKDIEAAKLLYNRLIKNGFDEISAGALVSSFRLDWMQKENYGSEISKTELNFTVSDKDIQAAKLLYNRLIRVGYPREIAGILLRTMRLDWMQKEKLGTENSKIEVDFNVSNKDIQASIKLYNRVIKTLKDKIQHQK